MVQIANMAAITYNNTSTNLPNWGETDTHIKLPQGYAYETPNHFVHIYGTSSGLNLVSPGLMVTERKNGTLSDWVIRNFGAQNIQPMTNSIGHSVDAVWRPGIVQYSEILQSLDFTAMQMHGSENALRPLVEKLDEILVFIEPDANNLNCYGHKTRELLILACTEVENQWKFYMSKAQAQPARRNFTTVDYVRLVDRLYLREYQIKSKSHSQIPSIRPFENWNAAASTASIPWYDAYNQTKHDRDQHFNQATLLHCLHSVAAAIVLHCVRFSPMIMLNQINTFSSLINQHFDIELINSAPTSYYLPHLNFPANLNDQLQIFNGLSSGYMTPYTVEPFVL
jgi:hypothetical protein